MNEYFANGRLTRLCLKELRESLRDRRTIVTLVLMPILLYPLLSMALQRLVLTTVGKSKESVEFVIGVDSEEAAGILNSAIAEAQIAVNEGVRANIEVLRPERPRNRVETNASGKADENSDADSESKPVDLQSPLHIAEVGFKIVIPDGISLLESLRLGELDIAIKRADIKQIQLRGGAFQAFQIEAEFRDADSRSELAMSEFRKAMQLVNDHQLALLRRDTMPPAVQMVSTAIGSRVDPTTSIAGIIPLVLILMTITGAVYPAIDLTAGERERGTMEAMIASPAPRFVLLLSKYVAVVTVSVMTALANLFASWITLSVGGLGKALFGQKGFSILALIQIFPLLVIFAAFFSAILLAMCSFARSFKEAQAYLIPVMLVSLAPALVTLMPNIEFSTLLGVVPLVNILLLSREIMTGSPAALPAFAAVFSTLFYAAAALVVASRLFGAESATSGSQESWTDLLSRPKRSTSRPDIGELFVFLALLFPTFFIVTNLAANMSSQMSSRMIINAAVLIALFLVAPSFFSWYRRNRFRDTYLLNSGTISGRSVTAGASRILLILVITLCFATSLWIIAFEALKMLEGIGLGNLSLERTDALENAKREFAATPLSLILITSAFIPAIAEEYFFRGFVLSTFRSRLPAALALLYSALLFGFFHIINGSVLTLERFVPTVFLGLVLGAVAIRTDTLWPGILIHAIHNGLLFSLTRLDSEQLSQWFGEKNEHFPIPWIVGSLLAIVAGCFLLFFVCPKTTDEHLP